MIANKRIYWLCLTAALLVVLGAACSRGMEDETLNTKLANPAVRKCLEDGFVADPILVNGVASSYACKNPETGKSCDAWDYFRGQCQL